jgi:hypothetical protein
MIRLAALAVDPFNHLISTGIGTSDQNGFGWRSKTILLSESMSRSGVSPQTPGEEDIGTVRVEMRNRFRYSGI